MSTTTTTNLPSPPLSPRSYKFATFDHTLSPLIRISLAKINNKEDFKRFLGEWDSFNNPPYNPYYFMFYTSQVSNASVRYCLLMSKFIKNLKKKQKEGKQSLRGSIIIVNRSYVRFFLSIIFRLQRPVADVYLVPDEETAYQIWDLIKKKQSISLDYFTQVSLISPSPES